MSVKTFVDTNILIYAHDADQGAKHAKARATVTALLENRVLVLSPQVLQEFYVNVTRKLKRPLAKSAARQIVSDFSVWSVETAPADIEAAFRIEESARISFWDALICAAAQKSAAKVILSEDMNDGQSIAGMQIRNPFL